MKFLPAFVAGALFINAPAHASEVRPAEYAFDYVCAVTGLDCSNLTPPEVRYADLIGLRNWYGYYWYSRQPNTVWLDVQFEAEPWDTFAMAVLIHETVHYVHRHADPGATACEAEALAYHVQNLWLLENGQSKYARWDWFTAYGCTL